MWKRSALFRSAAHWLRVSDGVHHVAVVGALPRYLRKRYDGANVLEASEVQFMSVPEMAITTTTKNKNNNNNNNTDDLFDETVTSAIVSDLATCRAVAERAPDVFPLLKHIHVMCPFAHVPTTMTLERYKQTTPQHEENDNIEQQEPNQDGPTLATDATATTSNSGGSSSSGPTSADTTTALSSTSPPSEGGEASTSSASHTEAVASTSASREATQPATKKRTHSKPQHIRITQTLLDTQHIDALISRFGLASWKRLHVVSDDDDDAGLSKPTAHALEAIAEICPGSTVARVVPSTAKSVVFFGDVDMSATSVANPKLTHALAVGCNTAQDFDDFVKDPHAQQQGNGNNNTSKKDTSTTVIVVPLCPAVRTVWESSQTPSTTSTATTSQPTPTEQQLEEGDREKETDRNGEPEKLQLGNDTAAAAAEGEGEKVVKDAAPADVGGDAAASTPETTPPSASHSSSSSITTSLPSNAEVPCALFEDEVLWTMALEAVKAAGPFRL
eukprot:PhM_4_TR18862/c3_g1_i1/m.93421